MERDRETRGNRMKEKEKIKLEVTTAIRREGGYRRRVCIDLRKARPSLILTSLIFQPCRSTRTRTTSMLQATLSLPLSHR